MELLMTLFSATESGGFLREIVTGIVVYFVARREVRNQFGAVNENLANIATQLKSFAKQIVELEAKHGERLLKAEMDIGLLKKDLTDLKIKLNP